MIKPARYHWLFLFALLCRLLAGEQAMAGMALDVKASDCGDHALMLMHAVHSEQPPTIKPAAPHSDAMHEGMHHPAAASADGGNDAPAHDATCDVHDCCPTGACDCACVHLTLLQSTSSAASLSVSDASLASFWLQPAPRQPPERVFRPPA